MPTEIIANLEGEPCNHGWIHHDRATTIERTLLHLPEPNTRRTAALDLSITSADELFEEGKRCLANAQFPEAVKIFNATTQLRWTFTEAHIELGNALSGMKDFQHALCAYQNALEVDRRSLLAHYNIALTFADLGDPATARIWLHRTINLDLTYRPAYIQLARLSTTDRNSIALLMRAARLPPKSPDPFVEAGNIYYENTDHMRAIKCYRRALRIAPWNANAFFRLGLTYYRNGRLPEAGMALANAVNNNPQFEAAVVMLKGIERRLSRKARSGTRLPLQHLLFSDATEPINNVLSRT